MESLAWVSTHRTARLKPDSVCENSGINARASQHGAEAAEMS